MSKSTPSASLTPKHVRAARALLAWSQQDLAKQAGVATSTIADFERGHRTPMANNAQAIRGTLEAAGVQFLPTGAVIGPPLPHFGEVRNSGFPTRWVTIGDLGDWAERYATAATVPTLLARLIQATHGSLVRLGFPSDEGVRHAGWDGWTNTDKESAYVPRGTSGWEIGTQRTGISAKATEDYEKRTDDATPLNPADSTFIFVTPRVWSGKDEWVRNRRAEGRWRDVRVYDAVDLVHWIETAPAVGRWLATLLGKRPGGTQELDEVWEEWSRASQWPLTEDLVLADRDEDAAGLLRWLRGSPSVLSVQATTAEEVVAFFHATLRMLPKNEDAFYRSSSLVITNPEAARTLVNTTGSLILVLTEPEPGLAARLVKGGHYVLQAYDDRPYGNGEIRRLARPSREGIAEALMAAGVAEPQAWRWARDSGRNLAILRRLLPGAPERLPRWAQVPPPQALLAALLAGGWDETSEDDKAVLEALAGEPYGTLVADLTAYVGELDSPLRKVGSAWRVASPNDAFMLLARHLAPSHIQRFEHVAAEVLGATDPRFDLRPNERWKADIQGVRPRHSGLLRHGIGEILILLALRGDQVKAVSQVHRRVDAIVGALLQDADERRWWSLSGDFQLLAEASPDAFLTAVEGSLDRSDSPLQTLFTVDDQVFATPHSSDLLWALEALAWSPKYLPRVSLILARLDAIDRLPDRFANRPINSLREIYLLWHPQTSAPPAERTKALALLRKQEGNSAWKLMLRLLPRGHDTAMPTATPRWRDFTVDRPETVTMGQIQSSAAVISEWLVKDVGTNVSRWLELLEHLGDLVPDTADALKALEEAEPGIRKSDDRAVLRTGIRKLLHHHRQFPDAEWALPVADLDRLEAVYDRLASADAIDRDAWLFDHHPELPNPSHDGWDAEERQRDEARRKAAIDIFLRRGPAGILSLARRAPVAAYVGRTLFGSIPEERDLDRLLEASLKSEDARERQVASGLIGSAAHARGADWSAELVARARRDEWGDTALLSILQALPPQRRTWEHAREAGKKIDEAYWRSAAFFGLGDADAMDMVYAAERLIAVGRARHALHLIGRTRGKGIPSATLITVLTEAVRQSGDEAGNEAVMFQHNVAELLKALDDRPDVSEADLAALEWAYLPLLRYSKRPARALPKALAEQPELFVAMLRAVFKPSEESGVTEPPPEDPEKAKAIANQAYRLLDLWDRIPGTREDGTIDAAALETWIKKARLLAKEAGREKVADIRIGAMLSASPMGADGNWPAEAVREVFELFRSDQIVEGFWTGCHNRRGVTTRGARDGGNLEREEAAKYRRYAEAIAFQHLRAARALNILADSFEADAVRHDERAERLDWD